MNMKNKPVWFCPKALFAIHGISVDRQKALRKDGMIPYHKRGNYIRYKEEDVNAWWEEGKVV